MTSVWTDLPGPRALSDGERGVLLALVRHTACAALLEQAQSAVVTGACACGCPSIRLGTDRPTVSEPAVAQLSSTGRTDYVSVQATAGDGDGAVQVVAHVADGCLIELEMYAGDSVAVDPPAVDRLHSFGID